MISTKDMKELEEKSGIKNLELMERAGEGIAKAIVSISELQGKKILMICYHGNNGGDGFVAARHLASNAEVDVLFVGKTEKFTEESRINYKKLQSNPAIQLLTLEAVDFSDYDIIVDAIFGTGVKNEIKDPLATLIKKVSQSKAMKVAIDVPSGINPNTGEKANSFFHADLLLSIHDIKQGLSEFQNNNVTIDIGLHN